MEVRIEISRKRARLIWLIVAQLKEIGLKEDDIDSVEEILEKTLRLEIFWQLIEELENERNQEKEEAIEGRFQIIFWSEMLQQLREKQEKERSRQEEKKRKILLREQQYTTIPELMGILHTLPLRKFKVNPSVITAGKICRKCPERIVPWDSFVSHQQEIWDILSTSSTYSKGLYMPAAELRREVANELGRSFTENVKLTVLKPVLGILREFFGNKELRQQLQFPGYATWITFNQDLEDPDGSTIYDANVYNLCSVESKNEVNIPIYTIDYFSPLKLSAAEILDELQGDIISARDLTNTGGKDFKYHSKHLVLAVITQLFSSMIKTGVQYGYVTTGEAIVFLYISDDPSQVKYHVFNSRNRNPDEPASLQKTAIARIVAFSIEAVAAKPPPQEWHDAAAKLDTWAADYRDIVQRIPEKIQKERIIRDRPDYETSQSTTLVSHLPVALQSEPQANKGSNNKREEKDPAKSSNLQTQNWGCRSQDLKVIEEVKDSGNLKGDESSIGPSNHAIKGNGSEKSATNSKISRKRVHERDYCSTACLLGLAKGSDLDPNCPNIADHGQSHLDRLEFLSLLKEQLANDRGRVTDCEPLWISGPRGVMFKITLSSHGYTVIAKGVELHDEPHLSYEASVYRYLHTIQGIHIPVCLGKIDLLLPYYHWQIEYASFLLQSYAGVRVRDTINETNKFEIRDKTAEAIEAIQCLGVHHGHATPQNIMINNTTEQKSDLNVQIIDFARATIVTEEYWVERERKKRRLSYLSPETAGYFLNGRDVCWNVTASTREEFREEIHRLYRCLGQCLPRTCHTKILFACVKSALTRQSDARRNARYPTSITQRPRPNSPPLPDRRQKRGRLG